MSEDTKRKVRPITDRINEQRAALERLLKEYREKQIERVEAVFATLGVEGLKIDDLGDESADALIGKLEERASRLVETERRLVVREQQPTGYAPGQPQG